MGNTLKETYFDGQINSRARDLAINEISKALKAKKKMDTLKFLCFNDGQIIGTGESDFTKGNVTYECSYQDKHFQLLDVPGIEGNESKYEKDVEEAVTKAHLIFYVNGTNKKPEAETATKIKKYMRREAVVYGICNVRGKADTYEFPEDQENIENTHKEITKALGQTKEVLTSIIDDRLIGMDSIQGLLGFCSVAYNDQGISTIDRNREKDLLKAQENYVRDFGELQKMRKFSRIDNLYNLIEKKSGTFEQDIYDSNKQKIVGTANETLVELQNILKESKKLSQEIEQEINHCKKQLMQNLAKSEKATKTKLQIPVDNFYSIIETGIYEIIKNNNRDLKEVKFLSEKLIEDEIEKFVKELDMVQAKVANEYNANNAKALRRLKENIDRINYIHQFRKKSLDNAILSDVLARLKPNLKDLGKAAFNIGGYILGGAIIGNIIGAVVGAVVGLIMSTFQYFTSDEKKIRSAQSKLSEEIAKHKKEFLEELNVGIMKIINGMRETTEKISNDLTKEISQMNDLLIVLDVIINQMQAIKKK